MSYWNSSSKLGELLEASLVAIGNFDGVHLGHQRVLVDLVVASRARGLASVVCMFWPHPVEILRGLEVPCLTTMPDRCRLLHSLGVEHCLVLPFTAEVSELSADSFLTMLRQDLNLKGLYLGENARMGKGRQSSAFDVRTLLSAHQIEVEVSTSYRHGEQVISSSYIRELLSLGDIDAVTTFLGRYHKGQGRVVGGQGLARQWGYPTINVEALSTQLPAHGVYLTLLRVDSTYYPSVTNIGVRPTVLTAGSRVIETHVVDQVVDLVPRQMIELYWFKRLRPEHKFNSLSELQLQIGQDVDRARTMFGSHHEFIGNKSDKFCI